MTVIALGLNHGSAPLDLRGRFAIPLDRLAASVQGLRGHLARVAPEAAILSTCNRTELYLAAEAPEAAGALARPALDWLAGAGHVPAESLSAHTYVMHDEAAARHAFRVASGLDSMVLGEPQILGQMKSAVREAGAAGTLGSTLHQLFQRSFSVAKEVRTATEIGAHSVSLAAAAVKLAAQLFEDVGKTRVLCVGAGEMIENVAVHFAARAPKVLAFANRTAERSERLAARHAGGQTLPLADLPDRLADFDIVVSCTASALPLIGLGAVERALKARRRRPMLLVDLAVPRDVEPEVARLPDAYLYTLDDLAVRVQGAGEKRRDAVAEAERIIDRGVQSFGAWLAQRGTVPLIQQIHAQADAWRTQEIARAKRRLAKGDDVDAVMEALAQGLSRKLLHGAMSELHDGCGGDAQALLGRMFLRDGAEHGCAGAVTAR